MEQRLMHLFGSIAKDILGTILKAFRRVFVSFILVFLIVAVGIEAASFFLNGKFPPDGTTHLAAAAFRCRGVGDRRSVGNQLRVSHARCFAQWRVLRHRRRAIDGGMVISSVFAVLRLIISQIWSVVPLR